MKLNRSAGILLHITSLPSRFGIGDLGPAATVFADFLHRSDQTYWQILPLNPTEYGQGHSPYSATSTMAGNTLLISPELLSEQGWLNKDELVQYHLPQADKTDFEAAEKVKEILFAQAWESFKSDEPSHHHNAFQDFCQEEDKWLHDFALYTLLKIENEGKPWFEWNALHKDRHEEALQELAVDKMDELLKIKWLQYVFSMQWNRLGSYCNQLGIRFFGDLPFYTSYDSADVWSNRELFSLDEDGQLVGVAGVPPDAFSDDGQLWGMPVFLWDVHKKQHYQWWIDRLKKNMDYFDLLRLDHFRAFADYWEVPAGAESAKVGQWKQGPRTDFFTAVENALGDLPFIAEDLGEIDQPVYDLRDQFHFAGMKVLQFAFGGHLADSPYIPHNYSSNFVVYTGTHDNNTTRGWFMQEGSQYRDQLGRYTGINLNEYNVHLVMCRIAYSSVADIAILPMQDLLGLDENARMNTPASTTNNWLWRLMPYQAKPDIENMLKDWVWMYGRMGK